MTCRHHLNIHNGHIAGDRAGPTVPGEQRVQYENFQSMLLARTCF